MATMNTSTERIDALIKLSDAVYPVIDTQIDNYPRARQILRLGMTAISHGLQIGTIRYAGDYSHQIFLGELHTNGLSLNTPAYDAFPAYREATRELPRMMHAPKADSSIDDLAIRYGDVRRATIARNGELESDAIHAIHLASLVLPYAAQYYPHLEQSKLTLYCLLHDLVEAYTGDIPSIGASDEIMHQKHLGEMAALELLKAEFGDTHPRLVDLVIDYENLADDEARFVKTFDKLDPGFTHLYSNGHQLINQHGITSATQFLNVIDATMQRVASYGSDYPDLLRDLHEMHIKIAEHVQW